MSIRPNTMNLSGSSLSQSGWGGKALGVTPKEYCTIGRRVSADTLEGALALDGTPERVKEHYRDWAETYDRDMGYEKTDGSDPSPTMVDQAARLGVYRNLYAPVDMTRTIIGLGNRRYDVVLCCGVFHTGHVPPRALVHLFPLVKLRGLAIESTRVSYCQDTGFQSASDRLVEGSGVELLCCLPKRPYIEEEPAHYWLYQPQ